MTRREAAVTSMLAAWIGRTTTVAAGQLGRLVGGAVRAELVGTVDQPDPHAALAELRIGGASIVVAASGIPIRALAQRLLGGPVELAAPRPLSPAEHAIWVLVVAAALEDAGVAGEVWAGPASAPAPPSAPGAMLALAVDLAGTPMTVVAYVPPEVALRVPPARPWPTWTFDVPVVVGRCTLPRTAIRQLQVRDVVTLERVLVLALGASEVGLTAAPGAVEAKVATGYVPAAMSQAPADAAQLELSVQLGTVRLTLRQLSELVPGQIVALGRPLAGPFELRAQGRLIGSGELVDVDGELGVRIVSLEE